MFRRTAATRSPEASGPEQMSVAHDNARLDPVRWRRPGRSTLLRWTTVALLLVTAAGALYARSPETCTPATGAPAATSPASSQPPSDGRPALGVPQGSVGVPVRLAEPAALSVLRAGDRVDLMAAGTGEPRRVATNALVIGVNSADDPSAGVFLAVSPEEARRAVEFPADARLSILVRPPS
jgi:hypothetical protein